MDSTPKTPADDSTSTSSGSAVSFAYPTMSDKKDDSAQSTPTSPSPTHNDYSVSDDSGDSASNKSNDSSATQASSSPPVGNESKSTKPDDLEKQFEDKVSSVPPVVPAQSEISASENESKKGNQAKKDPEKHGFGGLKALAKKLSGLKDEFVEEVGQDSKPENQNDVSKPMDTPQDLPEPAKEIENDVAPLDVSDEKSDADSSQNHSDQHEQVPVIPVNSVEMDNQPKDIGRNVVSMPAPLKKSDDLVSTPMVDNSLDSETSKPKDEKSFSDEPDVNNMLSQLSSLGSKGVNIEDANVDKNNQASEELGTLSVQNASGNMASTDSDD
ncbi:hypothetical protein KC622_01680, partial [Candidatus Dojkabacteria bacterium]|nr:hypothetical protein [Candidatus Dojkabacteria bacterium]